MMVTVIGLAETRCHDMQAKATLLCQSLGVLPASAAVHDHAASLVVWHAWPRLCCLPCKCRWCSCAWITFWRGRLTPYKMTYKCRRQSCWRLQLQLPFAASLWPAATFRHAAWQLMYIVQLFWGSMLTTLNTCTA